MLVPNHACNGFCYEQVASSLKIAQEYPAYRETFTRIADHWAGIAKECDGKTHPWTQWCHELPDESKEAYRISSNFVAHVFASRLSNDREPEFVAGAYHAKVP